MRWDTFRERLAKAVLRYRVKRQRTEGSKMAKIVYEWNIYVTCSQKSYYIEIGWKK